MINIVLETVCKLLDRITCYDCSKTVWL